MSIEKAYSIEANDIIDAEEAYELYWNGIINDKKLPNNPLKVASNFTGIWILFAPHNNPTPIPNTKHKNILVIKDNFFIKSPPLVLL